MDELRDALEEFVKKRRGLGVIPAEVTAVDAQEMTFSCVDGDEIEYVDVRTNAVPGEAGVIALPRVGSTVLIIDLGNQAQDFVMLQAGEIDQIWLNVDDATTVYIDDQEIQLGGAATQPAVLGDLLNTNLSTLITALNSLLTAIQTYSTSQAAATVGVLAPLTPAYTVLLGQLPGIQTQLQTLSNQLDSHLSGIVKLTP